MSSIKTIGVVGSGTMGNGIAELEEGVNTGKANYHGSPLKEDMAEKVLKNIAPLEELVKDYDDGEDALTRIFHCVVPYGSKPASCDCKGYRTFAR